jgi:hypothetical protein
MTEAEWLASADPEDMMRFLRESVSDRKSRLFCCSCCRIAWHELIHESSCDAKRFRNAVEVAERFADGNATRAELASARAAVASGAGNFPRDYEIIAGVLCEERSIDADIIVLASCYGDAGIASVFRDIFGNPFRPVLLDSSWPTSGVTQVAQHIYDKRRFEDMPILADALEDAGCDNAAILEHCRSNGTHVRGCWVVDLLLGKE